MPLRKSEASVAWLTRAAAVVIAVLVATLVVPVQGQAAESSDFNPGFLISDEDFFNSTAMTAAQADAFIDGMNKGCLTGRVCLENYKESIKAKAANSRCTAIAAASSRTAGQIVTTVAKACGISPKAILVILQKEQSLVTAQSPSSTAFQASMGAGCPDTAPCDGKYAGFYENVYYGAYLLKGYTIPGSSNYSRYAAGATSKIAYSPRSYGTSPTCTFKSVYVENQATHALYVYTPYTPNAAALKNLYGTGDSCSAYGNRNFWRLWTDWFGPTGSEGALAIEATYQKFGGTTGSLGARVDGIVADKSAGGGLYQRYAKGMIAWNEKTGAFAMPGTIANAYMNFGGPAKVGWPTTGTTTSTANGGGTSQTFTAGRIATSPAGAYVVTGTYLTALLAAGNFTGAVGWPTANASNGSQPFTGGTLFANAATKSATFVDAAFVEMFASTGGTAKWGNSTSLRIDAGDGAYQTFGNGALATSGAGTFTLPASTTKHWLANGGPTGVLGYPTAAAYWDPATREMSQEYGGGTLYTGPLGNGYVATVFEERVAAVGGITGSYGFPSGPLRTTATGSGQDFGGWSLASTSVGVKSIHSTMLTAWRGYGAENGYLGWFTGQQSKVGSVYVQNFEHGKLYFSGTKKAYIGEHFVPLIEANGGITGSYGWPTGNVFISKSSGGGEIQKFGTSRVFTWNSTAGAKNVYGLMLTGWNQYGAQNTLGWPTSFQASDAKSGVRSQTFSKGRLYATTSRNGWVPTALVAAYATAGGPTGSWGWPTAVATVKDGVTTQVFEKGTATVTAGTVTFTKK